MSASCTKEVFVVHNFTRANLFELGGGSIHVTFSSTSVLGGPILSYRDPQRSLSFQGEDIASEETPLGELITVTLEAIADARTVTFTLILPIVTVMSQSAGTQIRVPGVTTTDLTTRTTTGPQLGPQKLYEVVNLQGTAQSIVS
jgi:hypothetical protein